MAVQWGLGQADQQFDYLKSLQSLGEAQTRQQQNATNAYKLQTAQAQAAARPGIAQMAQQGDFSGARQAAAAGGDFDYATSLGQLSDDHFKQAEAQSQALGSAAWNLRQMTPEQRAQALPQYAAALKSAGFTDAELQHADLSDQGLDSYIAIAMSVKDQAAQRLQMAGQAETSRHNQAMESKPKWQFDSESGSWLQEPGTGPAYAGPQSIPQNGYSMGGGDPSSGGGTFARMIGAESNGRQFAANGQPLTSPAGAVGIAQVMPGTAAEAAKLAGLPFDEQRYRTDPDYNRALGEAYFNKQVADFGNEEMAAAAYNAGPGRVRQAIAKGGNDWRDHLPQETQDYVRKVTGGQAAPRQQSGPGVINVRAPKRKDAPSGYQYDASGTKLQPIPGGPADPTGPTNRNVQSNRKAEADFRKEFDALPEVKTFKTARQQFNTLRDLGQKKNPNAQDDIALIFSYMKALDPTSVVREGEFATAQNAGGVDDSIRNLYNKARNGTRLNAQQRSNMVHTAYRNYKNYRDAYNQAAENYRGYAKDNGINPDRVARTYTPDPVPQASQPRQISGTIRRIQ